MPPPRPDRETERRAAQILQRLEDAYPDARVELDFASPLQLLIATMLSAQSTDKRVNAVTPALFARYPDTGSLAAADGEELERLIHSTGFFRQKARAIRAACERIVAEHGGRVPQDMESLVALPGVGRKTANVVRSVAFGLPGIPVDTHCARVSGRLGLVVSEDAEGIERELGVLFPATAWGRLAMFFIWHGRYTCKARAPRCDGCAVADYCLWLREQSTP